MRIAEILKKSSAAVGVAGLMVLGAASAAQATSDTTTSYFDNGQPITANIWIQPVAEGGCGSFQSSAVMNASPNWIRNTTDFYQYGVGSVSVKGVSLNAGTSDPSVLEWTNSNGAMGSYLSGTVCMGWASVYLGADVSATGFYYGNLRTTAAHV